MRAHENGGQFNVSPPRVDHLLRGESLEEDEDQVDETLDEGEVPAVTEKKKLLERD